MPSIDAMAPSRFLKKAHLEKPRLGTIREVRAENVAPDNRPPEIKPVVYFREFQEGVPVGSQQREQLKSICGTEDVEGMIGKAVVLYVDSTVAYGGKMVGGIRFRAPKQRPPAQGIPGGPLSAASYVEAAAMQGQGIPAASPGITGGLPDASDSPWDARPAPPLQGWSNAVAPTEAYAGGKQDPPWMEDPDPDSYAADDFYTPEDEP